MNEEMFHIAENEENVCRKPKNFNLQKDNLIETREFAFQIASLL